MKSDIHSLVRVVCVALLFLLSGLGIWVGWTVVASGATVPASVMWFFCVLSVLTAFLHALAAWGRCWSTKTILLSTLALSPVCTFLPIYGPIFTLNLMADPFAGLLYSVAMFIAGFWYFIAAGIAVVLWIMPGVKGRVGECIVNLALRFLLNQKEYRPLKDLTLQTSDGSTTQIDHIVVSRFGVFVIETKNWNVRADGHEMDEQWWIRRRYHRNKPVPNPLRQNDKHVKVVQELLGVLEGEIHNVVVFVGGAKIEIRPQRPANVVDGGRGLTDYIKSRKQAVLDENRVDSIVKLLEEKRLPPGWKTNRIHRAHVKRREEAGQSAGQTRPATETPGDQPPCPLCGSEMVERTNSQSGEQFLGCSQFPKSKCGGTLPLPQSG